MRDIRTDLQERLEAIGRDRDELQRRISESEILETAIKALLKREGENFAAQNFAAPPPPVPVERNFNNFLSAKDAVSPFAAKDSAVKDSGVGYAPKDSHAPKEMVGVVKPSHWGELKVGS